MTISELASDTVSGGFILGLDLGQAQDYTALAVLERRMARGGRRGTGTDYYDCRWLKRWQLGTKYTEIVAELKALVKNPPFSFPLLAVDQTGVGRAVVDMIRQAGLAASIHPILITNGHATAIGEDGWHVPKKELVSTLQVLLQSRRLRIAGRLEHAETLQKELLAFRVKITVAANETFESWRERDHDDLVLAVAMAAWLGEHNGQDPGPIVVPIPEPEKHHEDRGQGYRRLFSHGRRLIFAA